MTNREPEMQVNTLNRAKFIGLKSLIKSAGNRQVYMPIKIVLDHDLIY